MEIRWTREKLIMFGYFILSSILLLDCTDNFPGTSILRKLKYLFLIFLLIEFTVSRKKISKTSIFVIGFLCIHTVLFGLVFINPSVNELTKIHCREMLIYLLFLFLILNAVERYNCKLRFIEATCAGFSVFFCWCALTHLSDFVNPLYFMFVFSRSDRIRSQFGTGSPNYMGYYCFIALVFFYSLWYEYKQRNRLTQKRKIYLLGISGLTVLILFSTGSRSSILSFIIFVVVCVYQQYIKERLGKSAFWIAGIVACFILIIMLFNWSSIWQNANRRENISINMPVFEKMDAWKTGMGYVESSGFYNDSYGYDTWPVDIYYLYIFLSTGVVGSIIMLIPFGYMLIKLLRKRKGFAKSVILPAYLAILFDGFWQVNIFTYRYIATLFIGVLLLSSISLRDKYSLPRKGYYEETKQVS